MSHKERQVATLKTDIGLSFSVRRSFQLLGESNVVLERVVDSRPVLFLVSPTIQQLYGKNLELYIARRLLKPQSEVFVVATGEKNKSLGSVEKILAFADSVRFSRRGVFVGIGGGVLLDIAGLAASTFRRGIPYIRIGTTLLAQVDAAIGVKCGVNFAKSKNLVGTFYFPEDVLTDSSFLGTLSKRQIRCGLAEMIKLAIVKDHNLFESLERYHLELLNSDWTADIANSLVDRSIIGMLGELQVDFFETNLRRAVDFGHTISPALEAQSGFSLLHGEAVAIDIALSCVIGNVLGHVSDTELRRVLELLDSVGLPRWHPLLGSWRFLETALEAAVAHRGMKLNMPLPASIGASVFIDKLEDLPRCLLSKAVGELRMWTSGEGGS